MRKVWVVVANSSQSKIYLAENTHKLVEYKTFEHEESHLSRSDLTSDRQGQVTSRKGYGTDTMEDPTPVKLKEAQIFATEIAKFLEASFNEAKYERLYLTSAPSFLGVLRQQLHPNVIKLIESEIPKDLTKLSPEQIREYLPPVL